MLLPYLQVLLQCPHFVSVFCSCLEIKFCCSFLHIPLGLFSGFLYLRTCHRTDYRILKYCCEVSLQISVDIS